MRFSRTSTASQGHCGIEAVDAGPWEGHIRHCLLQESQITAFKASHSPAGMLWPTQSVHHCRNHTLGNSAFCCQISVREQRRSSIVRTRSSHSQRTERAYCERGGTSDTVKLNSGDIIYQRHSIVGRFRNAVQGPPADWSCLDCFGTRPCRSRRGHSTLAIPSGVLGCSGRGW